MSAADRISGSFVWDMAKEQANIKKHGVDFMTAALAFKDNWRRILAPGGEVL